MKKIMTMVVAAMMASLSVNAQSNQPKHEFGVSYGIGVSLLGDGIGNAIGNGIFDQLSGYKWEDNKQFGTLGVEYFYHLNNPNLAVGAIATFAKYSEDVANKKSGEKVGDRSRTYIAFMPSVKYYWMNKKNFGVYTKAAVGGMMMKDERNDLETNKMSSDNKLYFMYQASLLGLEAGSQNLRAFAEAGVGEQGIILIGVRAKF